MEIKENIPIEVTQQQYNVILSKYRRIVFFRTENNQYFIKVIKEKYIPLIKKIIC